MLLHVSVQNDQHQGARFCR